MTRSRATHTVEQELVAFDRLKTRLAGLWADVFTAEDAAYTSIVVPSVTLPPDELARQPGVLYFEETLLFLLTRLRNPHARIVYVTSMPVPTSVVDYYLLFLAGIPASHARQRLTMLAAHDATPRPLAEKVLERPRMLERILAAIPDPTRAYLTVLRSTPLERKLAVALDIPLNAADPAMDDRFTRSGSRRMLRAAGVEVPEGFEDLHEEQDLVEAIAELRARRPTARRALVELNSAQWDSGYALLELPQEDGAEAARRALHSMTPSLPEETPESWLDRFRRSGGVLEELVEAGERAAASVQLRIDPRGGVRITSTHDELRGGPAGLSCRGCVFPAADGYRSALQDAGRKVARHLAGEGLVSRVSVEFIAFRDEPSQPWRLLGTEINLGFGGSTHPLLALRFLAGGRVDPDSGLFLTESGRPKFYRATDHLESWAYRGLTPDDVIEILTVSGLNYSPRTESGALFYMLGAVSELGRLGMVAIGATRDEAERVYRRTVDTLDKEAGA